MSEYLNKLRDEFEAWYCEHAARGAGLEFFPDDIKALRLNDSYGNYHTLNGKWEAYQALVPNLQGRIQQLENALIKILYQYCPDRSADADLNECHRIARAALKTEGA